MARCVDLVGEDDAGASLACRGGSGDAHRREEVGRAVGPRHRRVAHGTRGDEGARVVPEKVEQVGRLFEGVGSLNENESASIARSGALENREQVSVGE